MINSQQISFVMMIKLKCFKCAQTEWIDNKTMKSIRVEDLLFFEKHWCFRIFQSPPYIWYIFRQYTTTTNRQPDAIMKWNRVVFLSFASLLMNQLHQNVQFTAQLQYSRKWIERIAVHTTESNKTCANKRQHAFATALTVVDIGHKVYISIVIRNNLHVKRTETERTRRMNQKRKKERKKHSKVRKREKNWWKNTQMCVKKNFRSNFVVLYFVVAYLHVVLSLWWLQMCVHLQNTDLVCVP